MKFYQFMKMKPVIGKKLVSIAVGTTLAGSVLSLALGIFAIGTTVSGVVMGPTMVEAGNDAKVDRKLKKAQRQIDKAGRARERGERKAAKHGEKADKAMDSAEQEMGKGVRDDPGCNQPGVQC